MGDSQEQSSLLEATADHLETQGEYESANVYWELSAKWHLRSGDKEAAKESQIRAVECWYKLAEQAKSRGIASTFYMRALVASRQIPGTEKRREELHQLLLEAQQESTAELGTFSTNIGVENAKEQARKAVSNKLINEAIQALAFITKPSTRKELEEGVKSSAQVAPLQAIARATAINAMGKIIGQKPSAIEDEEGAFLYELHQTANFNRHFAVVNSIEPAREQILMEHYIRINDLFFFLNYNPFIPPRRIWTYAKGLYAGFRGDFMVAVNLLIPQLEESMRYILWQKGVITSGLDSYLIQHERNLNAVLAEAQYRTNVAEMIGEDLTFDLQSLLIDVRGANLRNDVAHGLLDDSDFFHPQSIYFWWVTLRLCCLWFLTTLPEDVNKNKQKENPKSEKTR